MNKQHLAEALFNFFEKEECEELNAAFSRFASDFGMDTEEEKEEREDLMHRCEVVAGQMIRHMEMLKESVANI